MDIPATVTSKGQITIPAEVRRALGLRTGDRVVFRLADGRAHIQPEDGLGVSAELEKAPDFFDLAGSVPVPADVDPDDWQSQCERAWIAAVREEQ